jgi:putative membrane protein
VTDLLVKWLILAVSFLLTAKIVPGVRLSGFWDAVVVAAIFGILNFFFGWFLTFAIGLLSLGLLFLLSFLLHWIVNAVLLKLTDVFTSRLEIRSFGTALVAALVMSLIGKAGLYVADMMMHHRAAAPGSVYII